MQRHHLLPRGLLRDRAFTRFFAAIDPKRIGFEDFRRNGLLLPCEESLAARTGLPLHRGPHPAYDEMVAGRVGSLESRWAEARVRRPKLAAISARMGLAVLQQELRLELLSRNPPQLALPRDREIGEQLDFAELDRMADQLWNATRPTKAIAGL